MSLCEFGSSFTVWILRYLKTHTTDTSDKCLFYGMILWCNLSKRREGHYRTWSMKFYIMFEVISWGAKFHTLQWWHNGRGGVFSHQPLYCLLNRLFRHRTKKSSKQRATGLCAGWPVNSPHKWPVTRKMFPFYDVIMRRASVYWLINWLWI